MLELLELLELLEILEKTVTYFLSVIKLFCVSDTITDIIDSRDASASKNHVMVNVQVLSQVVVVYNFE